ncbi:hypothetical protein FPQ13_11105 [Allobacillus salarius]|uniref:Uncharacterized protein n=1 Tax=Allobacillus salarius TaxID=1955272 RepID=A0A556PBI8_9BACI|nr:hypothetical protein FPQ13_11105 [Allobacillus salarius]
MEDWLELNVEVYIIIYGIILLWFNIDYLKDYKKIKSGLEEISTEEELDVTPDSLSIMAIGLIFNFIRRWLFYLLAVVITESPLVILISAVFFVISLYDTLFNYSLERIKKSKIGLYLSVVDTIYIVSFIVYLVY